MNNKQPKLVGIPKAFCNKFILFSFTIVFICMIVGLLFQNLRAQYNSSVKATPAGDLSIVGQPSLPAATVDAIFKQLGSPMAGAGQEVVQASHKANIDDAFALAVWWVETNDGAAGVGLADRNPGSVRGSVGYPSAFDGYTIYPSYSAAIVYWFNMLRNIYVDRGLSTVYAISHPYVGTSRSPVWAGKVVALMLRYRGEAPAAPTVVPSPTMISDGKRVAYPTATVHTNTAPVAIQKQVQTNKTSKQHSIIVRQVNASLALPLPIEFAIVFFALLLALSIVVWTLWLDKSQPIQSMQDEDTGDKIRLDEVVQGGGKPRPYITMDSGDVLSMLRVGLVSAQNMDAPNTEALGTFGDIVEAPNTDALGVPTLNANLRHIVALDTTPLPHITARSSSGDMATTHSGYTFTQSTGTSFRIRRTILLPSLPLFEAPVRGKSPAAISPGARSTGLLSRYGETHQE